MSPPIGYATCSRPRSHQKKAFEPSIFRWDDSAAVTATALVAFAAEHAEALKKPWLPSRIQNFLSDPKPVLDSRVDYDPAPSIILSGYGTKRFEDGSLYTGEFVDGLRAGQGRYWSSLGALYEGEWKNGQRDGKGIERYPIGNVYEGQFVADKRDGLGTMWYPGNDM
jgi:hypothetical protein